MIAANWWIKLMMKMHLDQMSLFGKGYFADLPNDGVLGDQTFVSEVDNSDFLIGEVEDLVLQMQDVDESVNSMIHVSYCLDQIVKDQAKRVLLTLIFQNSGGYTKEGLFWMFLMMNLQSLMTKMIESQRGSSIDSDLPKMFDVDKKEFVGHLKMILADCWKNFVYLESFCEANVADLQKYADFLVCQKCQRFQISDFAKLKMFLNLKFSSRRFSMIVDYWFYTFILYELDWMCLYMMVSEYWHVTIEVCTCNSLSILRGCTNWEFFVIFWENWVVFSDYVVCICISWIKFQALCFALYLVASIEMC